MDRLLKVRLKKGTVDSFIWCHLRARPEIEKNKVTRIIGSIQNIDEQITIENELNSEREKSIIQSRLASIGELAAGVGHEINNPLAIASGNLRKIESLEQLSRVGLDCITHIKHAHERIVKITDGLRNFARSDNDFSKMNLNSTLDDSIKFIQNIFRSEGVELSFYDKTTGHIYIKGKRGEIQQVIMNLLSNAKDATLNRSKRLVEVTLTQKNESALIEVKDNGFGIPDELKPRIFETFFTTKDLGHGTGVGLSIVQKIILDHSGNIIFDTNENGTIFKVELPQIDADQLTSENLDLDLTKEMNLDFDLQNEIFSKDLRVLVVEDEESIREIIEYMFEVIGLSVDLAQNGRIAYDLLKKESYDLIISDIQMPELSGTELLKLVRDNYQIKQPKFLFITGGVQLSDEHIKILNLSDGVIKKPFTERDLINSINRAFKLA